MAWRYEVRVKDVAGAVVAIIDNATIEFTRKVNGVGNHRIDLSGASPHAATFVLDGQVEVWRRDQAQGIAWYQEYEGFHRTPVWFTTAEGDDRFNGLGVTYEDLLARRVILYPKDSAGAAKTGVGETVIKAYVNENAGPGATFPPRSVVSGVTPGMTIQADLGAGATWQGDRAYENLLDVVREIANVTGVDFRVVGVGPALFQFRAGDLATDRTVTGLVPGTGLNGAGNPPIVFALGFGNMIAPTYSLDRREEINVVLITGQGMTDDRTIIERTDAAAIVASPWNRHEAIKNGNQEDTLAGLQATGDAMLEVLSARQTLDMKVVQTPASLYGRDYFLGDLVTIQYKTVAVNRQIQEVHITAAEGRETIEITMGEPP